MSVGRLERYKGHHRILRALPAILAQEPNARLVLVGSGPYEQPLRAMASQLGVSRPGLRLRLRPGTTRRNGQARR